MAGGKVTVEVVDKVAIELTDDTVVVELGYTGPQGPKGDAGDAGVVTQGYVHNQATSSNTWTIVHNLSFIPNITVVDSAGTVVEGSYDYPNNTTVVASFSSPFSGKAYLS